MCVCFKSGTFMSQGIRVPNSDFVRVCFTKFRVSARVNASLMQRIVTLALQAISRQYGHAIALTSANQSGTPRRLCTSFQVCGTRCVFAAALLHSVFQWQINLVSYVTILPLSQCALIFDGGNIVSSEHTVSFSANLSLHDTNQHSPI